MRNRCWILVEGGPTGGLVLLKQATERMKEKPVILVMNNLKHKRFQCLSRLETNSKCLRYKEIAGFMSKNSLQTKHGKAVEDPNTFCVWPVHDS